MKTIFLLLFISLSFSVCLSGQTATLQGSVKGSDQSVLIGANVMIAGTSTGTVSDQQGHFILTVPAGRQILKVTYIGYSDWTREILTESGDQISIDVQMIEGTIFEEIIVSASRRPEKLTESAATIQTVFSKQILEYAGNPAELIARQKGIDYFRAGIAVPAFNIRGFNSNFNSKNLQVTDGRFATLIATGLPMGPLDPVVKEDIERFEVVLGPNSTLYGPNAHNGLLNTITRDPRTSEETLITLNPGVTGDGDAFFSGRFRHAQVVNEKFSFKVLGEYTAAKEFDYVDSVYIVRGGVRDAYEELELDRNVNFARLGGTFYYSPNKDVDIIYNGGFSNSNFLSATNVGRNQIKDWQIGFHQLKVTSKNWFAQVAYTTSRTDSTYSIDERTKQYYRLLDAGQSDQVARGPLSYASGALFQDASNRWNAEIQYNNSLGKLNLITGVQYQLDKANSLGTYLLDMDENDYIDVGQIGGYVHLTHDFRGGWRALAAARFDHHEIYDFNFIPKFGILKIAEFSTWRLTYGKGIAAPTILNMFGNLFNGLILGNAEGFTLADGRIVEKQRVEKIQTFELGYRGRTKDSKLFIDANAYYNISEDFLSPVTVVGVATHRGEVPMSQVQSGFNIFNGLVATYVNFGKVNTYGLDISTTYLFTPKFSGTLNYSYFDFTFDEEDLGNDFNNDGVVDFLDFLVNAPTHKISGMLSYSSSKWYGSIFGRWVQSYNYFSSFQIASETIPGKIYRGLPIVENARSADAFNYGPLGGFFTMDMSIGRHISEKVQISLAATNVFNTALREFTATAPTRGLYTMELRFRL
ncbi:MAG TPA: TonB-dependent receptor [Saprospiraceae bacterium]|nr:TonB-dependent receptor [Saprospiraceae bacterium]